MAVRTPQSHGTDALNPALNPAPAAQPVAGPAPAAPAQARRKRAVDDAAGLDDQAGTMAADDPAAAAAAGAAPTLDAPPVAPILLAQAPAATASDAQPAAAPTRESDDDGVPLWLPLGLGAGIAALAGSGGASGFTLVGSVVAGPVLDGHGLEITAYRADGTALGSGKVNKDGSYSITVAEDYSGPILVRVRDTKPGADYLDEATSQPKDLTTDLRAATTVSGQGTFTVNVNLLTELAVRELGLPGGDGNAETKLGATIKAADITQANQDVAQAVGLPDVDLIKAKVEATVKTDGSANTNANPYGQILAAISGQEKTTGKDSDAVLDTLSVGLDNASLHGDAKAELAAGGAAALTNDGEGAKDIAGQTGMGNTDTVKSGWDKVYLAADGTADADATPTMHEFTDMGIKGVDSDARAHLLGDLVDRRSLDAVNSVAEIQALADIVNKLMLHAAGTPQQISQKALEDLGITQLTPLRTADLLDRITASQDDGGEIDSLAKIQAMVDVIALPPTLALAKDSGASGTDQLTNDGTVHVSGLEAAATWRYSTDGGQNWTTGAGTSLQLAGDGAKTVLVRQADHAGNESGDATLSFTLDTTAAAPTLALAQDSGASNSDQITNDGTVNVTGLETGATWRYSTDGGQNWSTGTGTSLQLAGDGAKTVLVRQTDQAGNESGNATLNFILDTTGPTDNFKLKLGQDTGSSNSDGITKDGTVNLVTSKFVPGDWEDLNGDGIEDAGERGQGHYEDTPYTGNFEYSTDGGQTWSAGSAGSISLTGDGARNARARLVDDAGNTGSAVEQLSFTLDTTAPVFSSEASASVDENTTTTVYQSNVGQDIVSYSIGGTDGGLFDIDAGTGAVSFKAKPDFETPSDSGADNVHDFTLTATDVAGNSASKDVALTVTDVAVESLAGQDTIDLGADGKLIKGVHVDGNWYYFWDRSGDGTSAGVDYVDHDSLDGIFKYASDFTTANPGTDTDNTYRYATINGVKLALPTLGDASVAQTERAGTAIDNDPAGEANPTYDDLLAIWDAHNGTGTGTGLNGTPQGWPASVYWAATPSGSGEHARLWLDPGYVDPLPDHVNAYVALQVL